MLAGNWKNIEELEENLTLDELNLLVTAARDKEHRHNRFMASLKGINIDEGSGTDASDKFDEVSRRAQSRLTGISEDALEFAEMGLEVETI